jgi:hypothetical protein
MAGAVITAIVALFFGGVVIGILAVVALGVRREDRRYSLPGEAPDRLSRGIRRLNGVGRRDLDAELFRPTSELVH